MKKVLVTGGAGFIGSHICISLSNNNYLPVIVDNFSNSHLSNIKKIEKIILKKIKFYKIDLKNQKKLSSIFKRDKFYAVIHCAGFKSVEHSIKNPINYFKNNIESTLSLVDCMKKYNVFNLVFSSSATVYNSNELLPWKETSKTGETKNPYGTSKYIIERILIDLSRFSRKWSISIARYFNPISNHSSGNIVEKPNGKPNNLIPYISLVAKKKLRFLKVFGNDYNTKDGTGVRDYIHVMDLADGHVAMLKKNRLKKGLKLYNFGSGKGLSVLDIIKSFEKVTGNKLPYKFVKKREGDIAAYFCSPKKANDELNWKSKYGIDQSMRDLKNGLKL